MNTALNVLGILLLTATMTAQAPTDNRVAATANQASGNADSGKDLYVAHQCFACHGHTGETGTRLLQEDGTFSPRLQTVRGFIAFIRAPRPSEAPPVGSSVSMPSYGVSSLPDRQAADLFTYIRTFKSTQPALKDIPVLSQMIRDGGKLKK